MSMLGQLGMYNNTYSRQLLSPKIMSLLRKSLFHHWVFQLVYSCTDILLLAKNTASERFTVMWRQLEHFKNNDLPNDAMWIRKKRVLERLYHGSTFYSDV
jgi:hypothetical protein